MRADLVRSRTQYGTTVRSEYGNSRMFAKVDTHLDGQVIDFYAVVPRFSKHSRIIVGYSTIRYEIAG